MPLSSCTLTITMSSHGGVLEHQLEVPTDPECRVAGCDGLGLSMPTFDLFASWAVLVGRVVPSMVQSADHHLESAFCFCLRLKFLLNDHCLGCCCSSCFSGLFLLHITLDLFLFYSYLLVVFILFFISWAISRIIGVKLHQNWVNEWILFLQ